MSVQAVAVCEVPVDRFEQANLMCLPAGAEAAEAASAMRESVESTSYTTTRMP